MRSMLPSSVRFRYIIVTTSFILLSHIDHHRNSVRALRVTDRRQLNQRQITHIVVPTPSTVGYFPSNGPIMTTTMSPTAVASSESPSSPATNDASDVPTESFFMTEQPISSLSDSPTPESSKSPNLTYPPTGINTGQNFGPNVIMIDSSMSIGSIQGLFDDIYNKQVNNEMGTERYSILFHPGTYGTPLEPLMLKIGYYTEVAGLGPNPSDVNINGKIEVYNRCFLTDPYYNDGLFIPTEGGAGASCFALNNFWRSLSNLSINIVSLNQDACRSRAMFWAISQASSMRRVDISGGEVSLMDYCTEPGFASGGYIADSRGGKVFSGGQQQFLTRNSDVSEWDGGVWNQMFLGVRGAPDDSVFPDPPYTSFETTPLSREKPYLFLENGIYFVHVPMAAKDTSGITWANGEMTPGQSYPLTTFFIVQTFNTVDEINAALDSGKHLLFAPGVYEINKSILVKRKNTVIIGLGLATLTAMNGIIPLRLADKPGIVVAGITLDAGAVKSDVLLQVGPRGSSGSGMSDSGNPITLSDVYFRVGGPHIGSADICLEVNSDNVLIDHTWVWRADHGIEGFDSTDGFDGDTARWKTNIGRVGVVVNGNNVTATGLFVEHYQEHNVVWNGEGGRVYFFQNELPYDPPTQEDWKNPEGKLGWAAYKVSDDVTTHDFWGGGVYAYNRNNPSIVTMNGFEVPDHPNVQMRRAYTRNLSGPGVIESVINGVGVRVDTDNKGPEYVSNYPF